MENQKLKRYMIKSDELNALKEGASREIIKTSNYKV